MTGCRFYRDGDRLVIRPGLFTTGWLVLAVLATAGGIFCWAGSVWLRPAGGWVSGPRDPNEPYYALAGLVVLAVAAVWLRAARRAVVIERRGDDELYLDGERIPRVTRVEVCRQPVDDDTSDAMVSYRPDRFDVRLVVRGGRLRVGRAGWRRDTDPDRADAAAEAIATFLGVPVVPAAAGREA